MIRLGDDQRGGAFGRLLFSKGAVMCRFAFQANKLIFYSPLACSTDADELYYEAKRRCESRSVRLIAVEPCSVAFSSAVQRPEWLDDPAPDRSLPEV